MIALLFLVLIVVAAVVVAGLSGMFVKTRRRTNKGNTRVAVDRFEDASRRVSAAQAKWFDLNNEALIVGGAVLGADLARLERAESEAQESSRQLYEAWLPISDVKGDDVASYNDLSRERVTEHKIQSLEIVEQFEKKLDVLERTIDEFRP